MFKLKVSDAKLLRDMATAISILVDEATFKIDSEGLKLRAMDPSRVAMIDFEWPKTIFEEYVCTEPTKMCINISELLKLIKRAGRDEAVELSLDDKTGRLQIKITGKYSRNFTMPTLEASEEEVPTPKITFNVKAKTTTSGLSQAIEDAQLVSDHVRIEADPEKLVLSASGDLMGATITLLKGSDALLDLEVKENAKATFSLSYLSEIIKAASATSDIATLEFSSDMPIRIDFQQTKEGKLTFFLAQESKLNNDGLNLQMEPAGFTKNDLAKYPFLKETARYISPLDLQIDDLTSPAMNIVLRRAEERVTLAINSLIVRELDQKIKDANAEILSFPVAVLLVTATDNSLIKKRYALAEAKQATSELNAESKEKILKIALDFNWKLAFASEESGSSFEFVLHFTDFLRNASHLHDSKWKLSNSILSEGSVYLNKQDIVRLLQEEIRRRIEKRLESAQLDKYPAEIALIADKLKALASERLATTEADFPKVIVQEAFPPCINALYEAASKNHHLSHMGRFTLTSFLVNIGMSAEAVAELFKTFSDFNERLTRYQVEHIAGERGSGTKYTAPQCSILQTHNVCKNRDELCRKIYHPLKYYQIKIKTKK